MKHKIAMICLAGLLATPAAAQEAKSSDAEPVKRFDITPAAQSDPALKYQLLPPVYDQIPGTAATMYFNAAFMIPDKVQVGGKDRDFSDLLSDYAAMSLADLKKSDAGSITNRMSAMDLLAQASLRDRAGWETTIRQNGYSTLLPYLSRIRMAANLVSVKARLDLADGDVDHALRTARILFAMGRHMKEDQLLIQALVGAAIVDLGLEKAIDPVMQSPKAPNLYWALANLPRPFFSMNECIEWERAGAFWSIPSLRGRQAQDLSPEDWMAVTREFSSMATSTDRPSPGVQMEQTAAAVVFYPRAKQELIEHGLAAEKVNAMPVPQVIGMAMLGTYNRWLDDMGKWANVPFWQAMPEIIKAEEQFTEAKSDDGLNFAYVIIPPLSKAFASLARVDRHIAALQTVEAIRAYAADHQGQPPAALADITATPAPIDPTTGKLFEYHVTGPSVVEISSPEIPGPRKGLSLHYVITIRGN